MTTQELKSYIDRILGNSVRLLLPSYWWKRAFGAVIDKVDEVDSRVSTKQGKLVSGNNIKTINGESVLGGGDLRVGVKTVESVEALESLEAKAGEIATIARKIGPQAVKVADCYVTNSTDNYASEWDKFTVIKKIEETDVNPESSNVLYICALNESFVKDAICVGYDKGVRYYGRIVDGVESLASLDIVNDILATGNYRLVIWAIAGRFDSYFTFYTEVAKDVSDAYIKGETWTRLLKEGDVTGGGADIIIDSELSGTSENTVQNKVITEALNAKADKTYVDEKTTNNSYAIVLASEVLNMRRYGKNGRSLGDVYIKPNVPTRVYATTFSPNGSTGRVKSIKLSHLDTQGATGMSFMFGARNVWQNVEELDLSYLDTSSVTVMNQFAQLPKVTKLDVTSFDTSNVVNMSGMFRYCENLTDIDLSNFDTSKVLYFDSMFSECKSLKSLDLSNFNTSSATTMSSMFYYCTDLEYLNLSSFDTSNIENLAGIAGMFSGCSSIKTLILGENFFRVMAPIETEGLQYMNRANFSSLIQWTDDSVVTSLVTNSYDRIANGLPEINLSLSSQTKAVLTDEQKAIIAAKGYVLK